ncbi:MAG: hypothetical protein K2G03_02785 [Bacilli bacterium]|nr:hypothetical protein [Bacilli bacterium]
MKKMIFQLLISPLTISDNYFVNYVLISLVGFIADIVAFKSVGDIGVRGEIGSLLHWMIRLVVFMVLWFVCCVTIIIARFIIKHVTFLLILTISVTLIVLIGKSVYNYIAGN